MSAPETAPVAPAQPRKAPRHPVEQWLVRGGIVLLLLCVGIQAHARIGYERSLQQLQNKLATDESDAGGLMVSEVPGYIVGWPQRSIEEDRHWRQVTYSWRGLTDSYQIHMSYDDSEETPYVLGLLTADPPEMPEMVYEERSPEEQAAATAPAEGMHGGGGAPSAGGPGRGGPGGGGPGGGGPRPDIMASDADGDGKVSREEAPERMAQFFDRMDANSDGFIDAEEVAEARKRRAANGGGPGGGGPGGPGPSGPRERPAAEESTPPASDAPADALQPAGQ